jgi:hypothetical protein
MQYQVPAKLKTKKGANMKCNQGIGFDSIKIITGEIADIDAAFNTDADLCVRNNCCKEEGEQKEFFHKV